MEITPWTIYLWQLADSVQAIFIFSSVATAIVVGIATLVGHLEYGSNYNSKAEDDKALS